MFLVLYRTTKWNFKLFRDFASFLVIAVLLVIHIHVIRNTSASYTPANGMNHQQHSQHLATPPPSHQPGNDYSIQRDPQRPPPHQMQQPLSLQHHPSPIAQLPPQYHQQPDSRVNFSNASSAQSPSFGRSGGDSSQSLSLQANSSMRSKGGSVSHRPRAKVIAPFSILPIRNCHLIVNGGHREVWEIDTFLKIDQEHKEVAVCTLDGNSLHFPHVAQQVLRCWSYWRYRSNVPPVLFISNPHHEYIHSLLDLMVETIGLQIIQADENTTIPGAVKKAGGYALHSIEDARAFRSMVAPNATESSIESPRIAILNRQKTRNIESVNELAKELAVLINRTTAIPIVYFEDTNMTSQMEFMANTDIVITPHGAQVTSIIAMPPCGGLVEIYPDQYYPIYFFGTLADATGILHQPIYLGNMDATKVNVSFMPTDFKERVQSRGVSLQLDFDHVTWAVQRMMQARETCLRVRRNNVLDVNASWFCEAK